MCYICKTRGTGCCFTNVVALSAPYDVTKVNMRKSPLIDVLGTGLSRTPISRRKSLRSEISPLTLTPLFRRQTTPIPLPPAGGHPLYSRRPLSHPAVRQAALPEASNKEKKVKPSRRPPQKPPCNHHNYSISQHHLLLNSYYTLYLLLIKIYFSRQ